MTAVAAAIGAATSTPCPVSSDGGDGGGGGVPHPGTRRGGHEAGRRRVAAVTGRDRRRQFEAEAGHTGLCAVSSRPLGRGVLCSRLGSCYSLALQVSCTFREGTRSGIRRVIQHAARRMRRLNMGSRQPKPQPSRNKLPRLSQTQGVLLSMPCYKEKTTSRIEIILPCVCSRTTQARKTRNVSFPILLVKK